MSVANIVGLIGGLLGIVGVAATAWAVARKGLKDETINTQAQHITALTARVDGLDHEVASLKVERDDCKTQLNRLQTTLDTVLERIDRQARPKPRSPKARTRAND